MKSRKTSARLAMLVSILNDGQYHDGTELGARLSMTRTAIWKAINKLRAYGVDIHSQKGKGHVLQGPLVLLAKEAIMQDARDKTIEVEVFESITSTNDYLRPFYGTTVPKICVAELQTKGKGRLQREWYSPFGKNIYLSCLFPVKKDVSELAGLSLLVGLAVVKACKPYTQGQGLKLKWPNDVMCGDKKLAGILIELQAEPYGQCCPIIGIGANVNMLQPEMEKHITQPTTSLREISGRYIDRNILCASLLRHLFSYLKQFKRQGLAPFVPQWHKLDYLMGRDATLQCADRNVRGEVQGICPQGHLLLKLKNGAVQSFAAGDASIVK